ncbi:TolC family protein [Nitrospirota bacterium]
MLKKILFIMLTVIIANTAYAERTLNLNEALDIALKGNHALRAVEHRQEAKSEEAYIARSSFLPSLTLEERYLVTDNPTYAFSSRLGQERFEASDFDVSALNNPEEIHDYQTVLSIEQLLYSKQASMGLKMARHEARAAKLDLKREKESVAYQVIRAYLGVIVSREYMNVTQKGVQDAEEHKRISRLRYDSGLGLLSDTLRTEVALKEAQSRLIEARNDHLIAKRMLGLLLGFDDSVDALTPDYSTDEVPAGDQTSSRSDIMAMELRVENSGNAVDMATSAYLPILAMSGSYILNDHETPFGSEGESYMVGVQLSWNFFDGGSTGHERAKAHHQQFEAMQILDGMRKEASMRIYEASLKMNAGKKALELALSREDLAEEGHRLIVSRYENSLSTLVELLDAQSVLDSARAGVIRQKGQYLIAIENYRYQNGTILSDMVSQGGVDLEN